MTEQCMPPIYAHENIMWAVKLETDFFKSVRLLSFCGGNVFDVPLHSLIQTSISHVCGFGVSSNNSAFEVFISGTLQ